MITLKPGKLYLARMTEGYGILSGDDYSKWVPCMLTSIEDYYKRPEWKRYRFLIGKTTGILETSKSG